MRRAALLALALAAQGARAEAPADSLRPEARPAAEALAMATPPVLPAPRSAAPAPEATRDFLPAVPRHPPLIDPEPALPAFEGLAGVVRAELLFAGIAPVTVVVDGWTGEVPPARPGAEASADAVAASLRPMARPRAAGQPAPALPAEPEAPVAYAPAPEPAILPVGPDDSLFAVAFAVVPSARPAGIVQRAERARAEQVRGQVCGNPLIQGEVSGPVGGGGCGVDGPVLVRSVDGVRLSTPATVDCTTAEALLTWVRQAARPAVGSRGGGLAGLEIMGSYVCRTRNHQAGAKMSEHGRGRAVDIGAVVLADGSRLSIARDWPDPALTAMHRAACGIFSTTLGPGSDGYHEDHLHFDTARGRGPYCR